MSGFQWNSPPTMRTCTAQTITWLYGGSDQALMSISITNRQATANQPIAQSAPLVEMGATTSTPIPTNTLTSTGILTDAPTSTSTISPSTGDNAITTTTPQRRNDDEDGNYNGYNGAWMPLINTVIATDVDPTSQSFIWESVNVTQGWYALINDIPSVSIEDRTVLFFVSNSTTDCLTALQSPSTTPSVTSPTLPSFTMPSNGPSPAAGGHDANHLHSNVGAIAGGVVGGVLLVAGVIVTTFIRRRRSRRRWQSATLASPYVEDMGMTVFPAELYSASTVQSSRSDKFTSHRQNQRPPVLQESPTELHGLHEDHGEEGPMEVVTVSVRTLQRLLRRAGPADLSRSGDTASTVALPDYEDVARRQ